MNQILVKVYSPTIEKSYDVLIPVNKKVYNVILLLVKAINELNDNSFIKTYMPSLYNKYTGNAYDPQLTVRENKIANGTEIIII